MAMRSGPYMKVPFWATREFRWFIIFAVVGMAGMYLLVFRILPDMQAIRAARVQRRLGGEWSPPAGASGPPQVRFDGMLEKVKDAVPIEEQDEAYQVLVRYLKGVDPAVLSKEAKSVSYRYYTRMPAELRGVAVKLTAILADSQPRRLDKPVEGVEWVHRAILVADPAKEEGYIVDLIEPPSEKLQAGRDVVEVEAVFLRLGTYEAKKVGRRLVPQLVGRAVRKVKEAPKTSPFDSRLLVVCLGVLAVACLLFMTMRIWQKSRTVVRLRPPR